jgi:predicted O-methyltransferase YrrM
MQQELWKAVDQYIENLVIHKDPVLDAALRASSAAGLPSINISPSQGMFLQILARAIGARKILEIGTLGGYSAIWLARALPEEGHLISLEMDPRHAEVARQNLSSAGLSKVAEVRLGVALETLPKLAAEGCGPFDLIFIDADKPNLAGYFEWAVKLSRRNSVIVIDNVVRNGEVVDPLSSDPSVQGVRRLNEMLSREDGVSATEIQTVGRKGYDGFAVAIVTKDP